MPKLLVAPSDAGALVAVLGQTPVAPRVPFSIRRPPFTDPRRRGGISVVFNAASPFDLKVVGGIAAFARESKGHVELIDTQSLATQTSTRMGWKSDGLIVGLDSPGASELLAGLDVPVVAYGAATRDIVPRGCAGYVSTDNELIAELAIDHLAERGFKGLAYFDSAELADLPWVTARKRAFAAVARDRGLSVRYFEPPRTRPITASDITRWLDGLERPVGVVTPGDSQGTAIVEACLASGLRVPDDVGVIGCDNDELRCQVNSPALTSVDSAAVRVGFLAARLLYGLIDGDPPNQQPIRVVPAGVVERRSSEVLTAEDPLVARAIQFIRGHVFMAIGVSDVLRAVGVSRSKLEGKFRADLGCTIRSAIRRAHLQRARDLIRQTDMPLKQVAVESGFKTVQHLTFSFVRAFGQTPAKYRRAKL